MSITNPSVQGIASLFRGNPAALQANMQKDKQANPSLPPDLTKALALNIDLNEQDAAKKQQALQQLQQLQGQNQDGKPLTIMQKLEQQMQQKQQMAMQQKQQQEQQQEQMKQALQAQMQQAQQAQQAPQQAGLPNALPQEAPQQPEAQGLDQAPSNLQMASGGIVAFNGEDGSQVKNKGAAAEINDDGTTPGINDTIQELKDAQNAQPEFNSLLEKRIRQQLGIDPHKVALEDANNAERMMGIKELLKEKEARVAKMQQDQEAQKAERTPGWLTWMHNFANADPRKGFGVQASIAGMGSAKAREAYDEQDRAFNTEINRLKDGLLQAQLEGNGHKVKAYTDALNRVRQEQSNSLTSGTSLENTRENVASRKQVAKDAAEARVQAAQIAADARADAARNKPPVEGLQEIASLREDIKAQHPDWTPAKVQAEATREYLRLKSAGIAPALAKSHADAVKEINDFELLHSKEFKKYVEQYGSREAARDALVDASMRSALPFLGPKEVKPIDVSDKPSVNNNSTTAPKKGTVRIPFDEKGNPK